MTFAGNAAAFIASKPISSTAPLGLVLSAGRPIASSLVIMSSFQQAAATAAVSAARDYSGTAISYFDSMRVPAALIAGSTLATLFSLASRTKDSQASERSQIESIVLIIYHILAVSSLLLSLNTVVTSTATSNMVLFGCPNPVATSAFALLKREYEFEFQLARWSFYIGLFSFLGTVATRALVEFELLRKRRIRSAAFLLSSFGVLFFHLLAFVNTRLYCYRDLGEMTKAVVTMWFQRSISGRSPSELASIFCFFFATGTSIALFYRSGMYSKNSSAAAPIDKS